MKTKQPVFCRILPVLVGLMVGSPALAQSDNADLRAAFIQAYERYQAAYSAAEIESAAAAAEESLALGLELFGENHLNTAGLRQNQALMLELQGLLNEAEAEYLKALDILEVLGEADSLTAVPLLIQLGGMYYPVGGAQVRYLQRALAIQRAQAPDDLLAYAELAVEAANLLSREFQGRQFAREILDPVLSELEEAYGEDSFHLVSVLLALGRASASFVDDDSLVEWSERALEIAEDAFGREDERFAESAMMLGVARFRRNSFSRAESALVDALAFYAGKEEFQAQEIRIRRTLADIYFDVDKSDEVTPHLIELGRLTAGTEMQEYQLVHQVAADYPSRAAAEGLSGYVVIEFTVTATGETENVVVIESSNPVFDRSAIRAVQRFRYIPRFIDGEPVEVEGVTNSIVFDLN